MVGESGRVNRSSGRMTEGIHLWAFRGAMKLAAVNGCCAVTTTRHLAI